MRDARKLGALARILMDNESAYGYPRVSRMKFIPTRNGGDINLRCSIVQYRRMSRVQRVNAVRMDIIK